MRFRTRALVKTSATNRSRFTKSSDQSRRARSVLRPSRPTGGLPPTERGRVRLDLTPRRRMWSRSTAASGGSESTQGTTTT